MIIEKRNVFDSLSVMRDNYKSKYETLTSAYQDQLKQIERNYKPSAPLYKQNKQKALDEYTKNIDSLKTECSNFMESEIEKVKSVINAEINVLPGDSINQLTRLSSIPLSTYEVKALADKFIGSNYWINRIVGNLAERNNVKLDNLPPDASTQIEILEDIEERYNRFLDSWNGEKLSDYSARESLADSQLLRLEKRFTNNFVNENIGNLKNVQIGLATVTRERDPWAQSRFLKNLYDNCSDIQKKYLLYETLNNDLIYSDAVIHSGLDEELSDFRASNDYLQIENSRIAVDTIRSNRDFDKADIKNTIADFGGANLFMVDSLHGAFGSNNDTINAALDECQADN